MYKLFIVFLFYDLMKKMRRLIEMLTSRLLFASITIAKDNLEHVAGDHSRYKFPLGGAF